MWWIFEFLDGQRPPIYLSHTMFDGTLYRHLISQRKTFPICFGYALIWDATSELTVLGGAGVAEFCILERQVPNFWPEFKSWTPHYPIVKFFLILFLLYSRFADLSRYLCQISFQGGAFPEIRWYAGNGKRLFIKIRSSLAQFYQESRNKEVTPSPWSFSFSLLNHTSVPRLDVS